MGAGITTARNRKCGLIWGWRRLVDGIGDGARPTEYARTIMETDTEVVKPQQKEPRRESRLPKKGDAA